jgi:hypothetical protein
MAVELNRTELKRENWCEYNVIKYEYYVPRKLVVFNGPKIYISSQGGRLDIIIIQEKIEREMKNQIKAK